jgi:hypothetical protein
MSNANLARLVITLVAACFFVVGYAFGVNAHQPYRCPEVQGGKVTQTIDSTTGQMCIYIPSKTVGQKTMKVTLR